MKTPLFLNNPQLQSLLKKYSVVLAYLFGSQAKGKATAHSDVDIGIVFSQRIKPKDYFRRELELAGAIDRFFHFDKTQIVNLTSSRSPVLKHEIIFKGKPILIEDRSLHNQTATTIMKEFEDTAYLRHVQEALLKKRMAEGRFGQSELITEYVRKKYVASRQNHR